MWSGRPVSNQAPSLTLNNTLLIQIAYQGSLPIGGTLSPLLRSTPCCCHPPPVSRGRTFPPRQKTGPPVAGSRPARDGEIDESGRPVSNRRPRAWKALALPTELLPLVLILNHGRGLLKEACRHETPRHFSQISRAGFPLRAALRYLSNSFFFQISSIRSSLTLPMTWAWK